MILLFDSIFQYNMNFLALIWTNLLWISIQKTGAHGIIKKIVFIEYIYINMNILTPGLPYVEFVNKWPPLPEIHVSLRGAWGGTVCPLTPLIYSLMYGPRLGPGAILKNK